MFSFLEGFSGYNQVLVAEPNRPKTTFRTNWGMFSFCRMLFGLVNTGATFRCAMDIALHGLIGIIIAIYLHDVTFFSRQQLDHLRHLKKIFEQCRKYGISLNPKESIFVVSKDNLLGYMIAKNGIKVDMDRVWINTQIPYPVNNKAMQSSLGKNNFLQKFISNYVQIFKQIQEMIKKNVVYSWVNKEKDTFARIK